MLSVGHDSLSICYCWGFDYVTLTSATYAIYTKLSFTICILDIEDQTFRVLFIKSTNLFNKKCKEATFQLLIWMYDDNKLSLGHNLEKQKMKNELDSWRFMKSSCLEPVLQLLLFSVVLSISAFICKRKEMFSTWALTTKNQWLRACSHDCQHCDLHMTQASFFLNQ